MTSIMSIKGSWILCLKIYFVRLDVFFSYLTHYHNLIPTHQICQDRDFLIHLIKHQKAFGQMYHSYSKILEKDSLTLTEFKEMSIYRIIEDICSW